MNAPSALAADTDLSSHRWFPDGLPDELLDLGDVDLLHVLGKPTLIRVPGDGDLPPRAISCLLHGDESTGYQAVMQILRRRRTYPFDLYVLIGNVQAAIADGVTYGTRFTDGQEDFNRVWGLDDPTTAQRRAADAMLAELRRAGVEALVDVHNNTGDNPFYAIVTNRRPKTLNLATLFTSTLLYWNLEANTLMEVLDDDVATMAVECGLANRPESLAFAVDGLRRYLGELQLRGDQVLRDFDMLAGLRKVHVKPEVRFRFGGELDDDVDFVIAANADVVNFVEVAAGHVLGHVHEGSSLPLRALDHRGNDVTEEHFRVVGSQVVTAAPTTPVMMTRTVDAARKDCLFYVTTELPPPAL